MERSFPLTRERLGHDACGVGFIAARSAAPTHRTLRLAVACLHNVDHRGARSIDGTGDGAGIMTRIPYRVLERDLAAAGIAAPSRSRLGLLMVFLPRGDEAEARRVVEAALGAEDVELLLWRRVPVGPRSLSETARASMPTIEQAVVAAPEGWSSIEFDRALFLARRAAERGAARAGLDGFHVASASSETVV